MRCVLYLRVSHVDDDNGMLSVEIQRQQCLQFASAQGWTVIAEYVDEGKSAYTEKLEKRPAFQKLMRESNDKRFDAVLVYKYDRLARKRKVFFPVIDDLDGRGIRVVSATESGDWLAVGLYGLMAEQYSRMLSARMTDVRRWEATQGLVIGPVPVGYKRRADRVLEPTEAARAVQLAFKLYCTGDYGTHRIADALNAAGYTMPNGGAFKITGVEEMLKNPIYAGYITYRGELLPAKHEPIIDRATWEKAREVQKRRARRRAPTTPRWPMLSGLAICADCGAPMWCNGNRAKKDTHSRRDYYACSAFLTRGHGLSPDVRCNGVRVVAVDADYQVCAWLAHLGMSDDILDRAWALLETQAPKRTTRAERQRRKNDLKRQFLEETISAVEYEQRLKALESEPEPESSFQTHRRDSEQVLELLKQMPVILAECTAEERRTIVRQLVSEVWIKPSRVIAIRPTRLAKILIPATRGMLKSKNGVSWWAGWASNTTRTHHLNHLSILNC